WGLRMNGFGMGHAWLLADPGFLPRICVGLLRLCVDDGGLVMSESRIGVVLGELAGPPCLGVVSTPMRAEDGLGCHA
ncbi:hypothetical protein PIB30_081474, partial [Stylosanthes scabra]|nr:hypothetical protein [Stylosanthes scabra]